MRRLLLLGALLLACGDEASSRWRGSTGGDAVGAAEPPAVADGPGVSRPNVAAGRLTAGAWDDNLNFELFRSWLASAQAGVHEALAVPRGDRMLLKVVDGTGRPIAGARVEVSAGAGTLFGSETGAEGRIVFHPAWEGLTDPDAELTFRATYGNATAEVKRRADAQELELALPEASAGSVPMLELALILDTTGSMIDELQFLITELDAILEEVSGRHTGVIQRLALVVYRDEGEAYVTRAWDFTSDLGAFRALLAGQSADAGGDLPEAVTPAFEEATKLSWSTGAVARVALVIADAPHHEGTEQRLMESVQTLNRRGVHVYPVASSGVDGLFEYTMRSIAQLTGGRYLFLTDDSGVGNPHAVPSIPCFYVTRLDRLLVRAIDLEISGRWAAPPEEEIIRTSGTVANGVCALPDGRTAQPF